MCVMWCDVNCTSVELRCHVRSLLQCASCLCSRLCRHCARPTVEHVLPLRLFSILFSTATPPWLSVRVIFAWLCLHLRQCIRCQNLFETECCDPPSLTPPHACMSLSLDPQHSSLSAITLMLVLATLDSFSCASSQCAACTHFMMCIHFQM